MFPWKVYTYAKITSSVQRKTLQQVVKVIWQKAASPPRMNHSIICSRKTLRLNGFNIKRFVHPYCLHVLFLDMRWHWLKRRVKASRHMAYATRRPRWSSTITKNVGRYLPGAHRTAQGKESELILTVNMETKHSVEEPFGRQFPAICNHCGVITACKSQDLEIL